MSQRIVLLNGVGSAGKSSIARELQKIVTAPYLHVEMDAFLAMLPERYWSDPAGMVFEKHMTVDGPIIDIKVGPVVERLLAGMRQAALALADSGSNLIIDEVMEEDLRDKYSALIARHRVHLVGLHCPLDVLEAREKQRGDREVGLARGQFFRLHQKQRYDLELDSAKETAQTLAKKIKEHFQL